MLGKLYIYKNEKNYKKKNSCIFSIFVMDRRQEIATNHIRAVEILFPRKCRKKMWSICIPFKSEHDKRYELYYLWISQCLEK